MPDHFEQLKKLAERRDHKDGRKQDVEEARTASDIPVSPRLNCPLPARRRPALVAARLERADELRAPGPGRHIRIYANSGHAWMTIDGRRFDTSAQSQTGSRWGGSRGGAGFVVRHPVGY